MAKITTPVVTQATVTASVTEPARAPAPTRAKAVAPPAEPPLSGASGAAKKERGAAAAIASAPKPVKPGAELYRIPLPERFGKDARLVVIAGGPQGITAFISLGGKKQPLHEVQYLRELAATPPFLEIAAAEGRFQLYPGSALVCTPSVEGEPAADASPYDASAAVSVALAPSPSADAYTRKLLAPRSLEGLKSGRVDVTADALAVGSTPGADSEERLRELKAGAFTVDPARFSPGCLNSGRCSGRPSVGC